MKKYFCTSDVHSYYDEFIYALNKAGFDKENPEHILIICGDLFDRGSQTIELYNFIKSMPINRRILIKGNHEALMLSALNRNFPYSNDYSNGTVLSCCDLAGVDYEKLKPENIMTLNCEIMDKAYTTWENVKKKIKKNKIDKWLNSNEWVNYYELDKYIFVHSFIPLHLKNAPNENWFRYYYCTKDLDLIPVPNWRSITDLTNERWEEARWGKPYELFQSGFFDDEIAKGKVLVCGHWHASAFHDEFENDDSTTEENFNIYYGKNLIALDACTAFSKFCNILVLEEESDGKLSDKCYDGNGNLLKVAEDI